MIEQNKLYLEFVKLNITQAIGVLDTIIESESKQGYESTADLVQIQELKELWSVLRYEIRPKIEEMRKERA